MTNLTRTNAKAIASTVRNKLAAGAVAALALGYSVAASAQNFGTEIKTEIDAGKSELWLIGGAILLLCVVTALVNRGKSVTK